MLGVPYTNFQELNLDWILQEVKKLDERLDAIEDYGNRITVLERDLEALQNLVARYNTEYRASLIELNTRATKLEDNFEILDAKEKAHYAEYVVFVGETREAINRINRDIASLTLYINQKSAAAVGESKLYTDLKIQELLDSLPDLTNVLVINPFNGELVTIQAALDYMASFIRYLALTALEFDMLGITCTEFDNSGITCEEFDGYGREFLTREEVRDYAFSSELFIPSPFTGEIVFYGDVIRNLTDLHRWNTITAELFDDNDKSANEIDSYDFTAYDYDWKSLDIFATN